IVTDSSADLSPAVAEEHKIEIVPLTIRFGDEEFVDRQDLSAEGFWERLSRSDTLPSTAAPSVGAFGAAYQRLADTGADGVVAVTISQDLSGTFQSASLAAEDAPLPVRVIDSRTASIPLGLTAIAAADASRLGASLDDVEQAVARAHPDLLATLDTLEYLQKGGRIGAAQAFFGGLLNVKPLITFTDGAVAAAGRVRTRRKALAALLDWISEQETMTRLGVVHGNAPDIDDFLYQVRERAPEIEPLVALAGPVIGTHAGPGVVGIAVSHT
ncbi:MAG: DegV family protein, partial [Acidimicrobiia bacterium]|nr:DegV family protein [Acidimicrobiia bacterium]